MPTLAKTQCQEFFTLQDFADALEASLPPDRNSAAQEKKLENWRETMSRLAATDLEQGRKGKAVLDAILILGEEMYRASFQWPKGDIFEPATYKREVAKEEFTETVGKLLADHDAKRYMDTMASISPKSACLARPVQRYNAFCTNSVSLDAAWQEYAALMKHELHHMTGGEVAPPGPRDAFDPALVTIRRHWQSVTQLTTSIAYDGQELGNFGDKAKLHALGHYVPEMTETAAIHHARRMFYEGHPGIELGPLNQSSLQGMIAQVERDLETAEALSSSVHERMQVQGVRQELEAINPAKPATQIAPGR